MSNIQCKGILYDDSPCMRDVVENSEWCIFHYPFKTGELIERFNREFIDERQKQEEEHPDFLDFTGFDFPNEVTFKKELPEVYFTKTMFRKSAIFICIDGKSFVFKGDAWFDNAAFKGIAWFEEATFEGEADFEKAIFKGIASFQDATFKENTSFFEVTFETLARFNRSTFEGGTHFDDTTFKGPVSFSEAIYKEYVRFDEATFEGDTCFDDATFKGFVWFDEATHKEESWFRGTTFEEDVSFERATFEGDAWFERTTFKGVVKFIMLSISSQIVFEYLVIDHMFTLNILHWLQHTENESYSVIIKSPIFGEYGKLVITRSLGTTQGFVAGISLLDTEMEKIEFLEEVWPRLYNRNTIIDEVFLSQEIEYNVKPPYILSPERVAQTYRRLRKNYEDARRYPYAGDFLIGEMEVTRKFIQNNNGSNMKRSYLDPIRILFSLYYILGKYGESISRPLIWLGSIWILLSELFFFYTYNPQKYTHFLWCLLDSLYYTLSSMFPFTNVTNPFEFFMKLIGSLLLCLTFIALRRRLERR